MTKHTTPRVDRETMQVSAQVLVRSASGARVRGDVPITSRNIAKYAPAEDDTNAARQGFHAAGFDVGNLVGISFSITAPVARFEQVFKTTLHVCEDGAVEVVGAGGGDERYELPLSALPADLAERIVTVTFTPPADLYGPGKSAMF